MGEAAGAGSVVAPGPPAPARGDIIWLDFEPQAGREQSGRRPALVLSHEAYNRRTGLAVVVPITGQVKGYPFELGLPEGVRTTGVVLADHLGSKEWRERNWALRERTPAGFVDQVLAYVLRVIQ